MAFLSIVRFLIAWFNRFAAKHNLGSHTIFVVAAFLEAQWLLNPAFKSAVMSVYNHTGVLIHALIPMAGMIWVNYRDASKKDQPQPSTEPAPTSAN